jgi:hypothetical protein
MVIHVSYIVINVSYILIDVNYISPTHASLQHISISKRVLYTVLYTSLTYCIYCFIYFLYTVYIINTLMYTHIYKHTKNKLVVFSKHAQMLTCQVAVVHVLSAKRAHIHCPQNCPYNTYMYATHYVCMSI